MNRFLLLFFLFVLIQFGLRAQHETNISDVYSADFESRKGISTENIKVTNDSSIDVLFYHLRIMPAIDSAWIQGHVSVHFMSKVNNLNFYLLDLHQSLQVDSIIGASSFLHTNDSLFIYPTSKIDSGIVASVEIFYKGYTSLAGGFKGLRYSTHGNNEPVIATLSTPYLAHFWFPCKDGPADKVDSVYIDITIPSRNYNNIPLRATSNGLLKLINETSTYRTFQWKHRYPIVSYYVMMAISNYVVLEEEYCNNDYCFPLEYHVFAEDTAVAKLGVAELPEMMGLFESLFGPYPFRNEKYGMTQLGFYGAIENQTNTVINRMSPDWKMVVVHELAHMWFGCQITCSDWHHGWLNEGFATYCEALWKEHKEGFHAYSAYMASKGWYQEGTVHLENIDDPFNIFIGIIYNKGAWVLHMLRSTMGDEMFFSFLNDYASLPELSYGHVSTERFKNLAEEAYGSDLDYYFDQWVYDEYYPSYLYNFEQSSSQLNVQLFQMQAQLGRRPLFITPIDFLISFSDFSDTIVQVFNNNQNQLFNFTFDKTVVSVQLDPNQWLLHSASYNPELPVGLPKLNRAESFTFYPNPTYENIMVQIENNLDLPCIMTITDVKGIERTRVRIFQHYQLIDLKGLGKGMFFLKLINKEGTISGSKKLIIK